MPTIEKTIEVDAPVSTAYAQWAQFEEFPSFMDGVDQVTRRDETHMHWVASIGGKQEEWDAEITEQVPDQRIAWRATSGKPNSGVVTFHPLGDTRTKVALQMEWESEGMLEGLGALLGQDDRKVEGDLERFKALVETPNAGMTRDTTTTFDEGMTPDAGVTLDAGMTADGPRAPVETPGPVGTTETTDRPI